MRYALAHRARARDPPRVKNRVRTPIFGVLGGFRTKNATSSSHVGTFLCDFRRDMNILRSNRRKCGSGRRLVEGVDMRKSQKSPSSEPLTQRGTHLYVSLRNHCDAAKMSNFFSKGPLRGTKSSVITSRARGLSVLRRKNGFEPRFGAFLANSNQHSWAACCTPM